MSRRSGSAIAYVDESVADHTRLYTMTAVIVDRERLDAVRRTLEAMAGRRGYLRGRDLSSPDRSSVLNYLGAYPGVRATVTAHAPLDTGEASYRSARQRCLAELVARIAPGDREHGDTATAQGNPVKSLILPRWQAPGDAQHRDSDQRTVAIMRATGAAENDLQLRHADPQAQPVLWAADVLGTEVRASLQYQEPSRLLPFVEKTQIAEARTVPALILDDQAPGGPRLAPYVGKLPTNGFQDRIDLVTSQASHNRIANELAGLRATGVVAVRDLAATVEHGTKLAGARGRATRSERNLAAVRSAAAKRAPMENYLRDRPSGQEPTRER